MVEGEEEEEVAVFALYLFLIQSPLLSPWCVFACSSSSYRHYPPNRHGFNHRDAATDTRGVREI
jgi:hypothetical protein